MEPAQVHTEQRIQVLEEGRLRTGRTPEVGVKSSAAKCGTPSSHRSAIEGTNSASRGTLNQNPRFYAPGTQNAARGAIFEIPSRRQETNTLTVLKLAWPTYSGAPCQEPDRRLASEKGTNRRRQPRLG